MGQIREAVRTVGVMGAVAFAILGVAFAHQEGKGNWIAELPAYIALVCVVVALTTAIPVHRKDSS